MNIRSFVMSLSMNRTQSFMHLRLYKHDCGRSLYLPLDIDECRDSVDACDANANCQNTWGSFSCSCKAGFIGDGKSCSGKGVDNPVIYSNTGNMASVQLLRAFL